MPSLSSASLLAHEPILRLSIFLGVLLVMAGLEFAAPRRRVEIPRLIRWSNNLALVALDTALVRLAFPVAAVGVALAAEREGWGLFNIWSLPDWLAVLLCVLILDFAIYLQHVLFHSVPALWRLHRVHHADLECDVSTALRFHPAEILLSMGLKIGLVAALGPPAVAVLIFEVLLNACALFNHSNVHIPQRIDRWLRLVIVTPDMHRVHHSIDGRETDSNYGFSLPWWDRLLGTYVAQPKHGHEGMTIGFEQFRKRRELWLDRMLVLPLRGPASGPDPRERTGAEQTNSRDRRTTDSL